MKIYIAGPMRGYPEFNFPAFHAAAAELRSDGHEVFSPAENTIRQLGGADISKGNDSGCEDQAAKEHGFDLRTAMAVNFAWLCLEAEAIAMLHGWHSSKGARAEIATAEALDLTILFV